MGMGVFDKKQVRCPAGTWTNLIYNFGSGHPKTFQIRLTPTSAGSIEGQFRERRSWLIFPRRATFGPLGAEMEFHRKWVNGYYRLDINPGCEVVAQVV